MQPCASARALVAGTLLCAAGPLAAQMAPSTAPARPVTVRENHSVPVPSAGAVRRTTPVVLDAVLDEDAWRAAEPVTDFTQFDPDEGKPATQRTEIRFLFDEGALYVGAKMFDTEGAAGVRTRLVRRDQDFNSDYLEIVIDGFHDHLGRAFFSVNPSGSKGDMLGIGTSCCDEGWDPVWETATRIDPDGWSAEIRIPLSQLRFSSEPKQTWGLQLRRFIQRRNELDQWAFWGKKENGGPARFGHLDGLELGKTGRHLEVLPYVASKVEHLASDPGDPFRSGNVSSAKVGVDLKYSLNSSLTLDATFNPDFGQVEVDPAIVNLSDFEVSFPERRPFFVASSGVFGYGSFNCFFCSNVSSLSAFYSRRIGRPPSGADLAYGKGEYVDLPDATSILGAAKVTGRTRNGFTIGLLDAVTNREMALVQRSDGGRLEQQVEPLTNYFVGRLKKDFLGGNLVIGGIGTSVIRNLDADFVPRLTSHAEFVGTDFQYRWKDRVYSLVGNLAVSSIDGDARVISARQRSSARYFQRPDREARSNGGFLTDRLDPSVTTMRGGAGYMRLAKDAGDWMWETAVNARTPGFENNDLAFLTRTDYIWYNANVFRAWRRPTSWYRDFNIIVGAQQQQNFDGDRTDRQAQIFFSGTTPQFWSWTTFYIWHPKLLDDRLLRGGPVVERPGTGFASVELDTDSRKKVVLEFDASRSWNDAGGWGDNFSVEARYRPSSQVSLSLGPSWFSSQALLQYVRAVGDPTATKFYGTRYVVSGLRQRQLALDTRASITFSPTMTFELYTQPLMASGHYSDFKEFNAPRQGTWSTYGKDRGTVTETRAANSQIVSKYTIDPDGAGPAASFDVQNPDFTFRSLRGNAVYRWEYRPGSVLYVAWTQSRSANDPNGDFSFSRDFRGLFETVPESIFLVKASWWLPR